MKRKNQPPRSSHREPTSGRWHLGRRHTRGIVTSLARDLFNMSQVEQNNKLCVEGRPPFECIALLLQGGGALGAYQAGVYEALAEAGIHPDWVAGISIGAINSAIIAGNAPEERVNKLRQFWEGVSADSGWNWNWNCDPKRVTGDIGQSL